MRSFYVECDTRTAPTVCGMLFALQSLGDDCILPTALHRVIDRRAKRYRIIFTANELATSVIADGTLFSRILPCNQRLPARAVSLARTVFPDTAQKRIAILHSILQFCYGAPDACLHNYDKRMFDFEACVDMLAWHVNNWAAVASPPSPPSSTTSSSPPSRSPWSSPPSSPLTLGTSPSRAITPTKVNNVTFPSCGGSIWGGNTEFSIVSTNTQCVACSELKGGVFSKLCKCS